MRVGLGTYLVGLFFVTMFLTAAVYVMFWVVLAIGVLVGLWKLLDVLWERHRARRPQRAPHVPRHAFIKPSS